MSDPRDLAPEDTLLAGAKNLHKNHQLVFDLGHTPSMSEADFIVTAANERAFAHVIAFPNWHAPLSLIVGPAKAGKSHLGNIWATRAGATSAQAKSFSRLASEGGANPVLLDDIDRCAFVEADLFHLLNQSMRDARPVLMTARSDPQGWQLETNDVLSRVRLAARFQVEPADDVQLSHMFVKLFEDRQLAVEPKVIAYLVQRMERSPQEAVALVALMDRLALIQRTALSRSIASEAIALRTQMRDRSSKHDTAKHDDAKDLPDNE